MEFIQRHLSAIGWLIGILFNIVYTFMYQNTGVFQNTLSIGFGRVVGFAVVSFIIIRPIAAFRGRYFLDRYLPWVFLAISVIIR